MGQLFEKMDTRGAGEIDWDEFCTYMMQDLQDKELLGNEREARYGVGCSLVLLWHCIVLIRVVCGVWLTLG